MKENLNLNQVVPGKLYWMKRVFYGDEKLVMLIKIIGPYHCPPNYTGMDIIFLQAGDSISKIWGGALHNILVDLVFREAQ